MAEDIVIPGQYNDLTRKDQLNSLNQVVKELSETISDISRAQTLQSADTRIQVVALGYPFL